MTKNIAEIVREIIRKEINNTKSMKYKEIKPFFMAIKKRCPLWSDYLCFADVVTRTDRNRETIRKNFNKLVNKEDFIKEEKQDIMNYLYLISGTEK